MFLFSLSNAANLNVTSSKCDRSPDGIASPKLPSDGRFKIKILGNPEFYTPNEDYTSECGEEKKCERINLILKMCFHSNFRWNSFDQPSRSYVHWISTCRQ